MSVWFFLFRELLGAIRARVAALFLLSGILLCLFLLCVAGFFLISPARILSTTEGQPIDEIRVFLSPRVPSATVDQLFHEWWGRSDVARVHFRFAQELDETATGGVLIVSPSTPEAAPEMVQEFRSIPGVLDVVEIPRVATMAGPTLSRVMQIVLLAVLVAAVASSLLTFRRGYAELLTSFSGEIRLLRLSGTSERALVTLTVALGVLIGFLGGIFLFSALFILHQISLTADALVLFDGLTRGGRIVAVGSLSLLLGTLLGALAGLLGASSLHRREFEPLP